MELEQVIRERAYLLWIADGRPEGSANTHWLVAQREILAASLGSVARVTVSETATKTEKKPDQKAKLSASSKKKRRAA
jgi:hypothetical protein